MKSSRKKQPARAKTPAAAASRAHPASSPGGSMLPRLLWSGAILTAALGIYWLPWLCPPEVPASGDSYLLGFNNRIAILALGGSIFLAAAARFFSKKNPRACEWLGAESRLFPPWREGLAEYAVLITVVVIKCGALWFWSQYLIDLSWCEARMFLYDIDLMKLGQVPYRDFMFIYGPGMLYFPYWLSRLSGGAISTEQAYSVAMVLAEAVGFAGVWLFVRRLELRPGWRWGILLMCLCTWLTTAMGLQYTVVRFFGVATALILLDQIARAQGGKGGRGIALAGILAAVATTFCLAISPDIGMAGSAAVAAYGFALWLRKQLPLAVACWVGAVAAFAANLVAFPGYLESIMDISAGTNLFPVLPSIYTLWMVAIVLLILPALLASALRNPAEARAPLALALAVGGGMMLPAAFSRCDMGHVIINSTIPTLFMFPAAQARGKWAFRGWLALYVATFLIYSEWGYWQPTGYLNNFKVGIGQHDFYKQHPEVVAHWKEKWDDRKAKLAFGSKLHWSTVLAYPEELDPFTAQGTMALVGGSEWNMNLARYLMLQKDPPFEYYDAYSLGAQNPREIETKVRQASRFPFLLVPDYVVGPAVQKINMEAFRKSENASVSAMTLFPVDIPLRRPPYFPDAEFLKQVLPSYQAVAKYQNYYVFEKRTLIGH